MMYLRGSTGYPYKRRKVHPANRPINPLEDILDLRLPEYSCQTIPCSDTPSQYSKTNPSFAACTRTRHGRNSVQALHTVRMPRIFLIGAEEAERERQLLHRKKRNVESPSQDVDMDATGEEEEEEKEEELVLTRDPTSQYYYYEALPDPNLVIETTEPFVIPTVKFDPTDLGSFPTKASDLMLFREVKRKRVEQVAVDDLEDEESAQPERENPPGEMLLPDAVRPARHLRLKYFDNPTLEIQHPSVVLKEVLAQGEPGVRARSRNYFLETKTLTWNPCLVVSYDDKSELYSIRWFLDGKLSTAEKQVTRLNLIFDYESETSFILRRLHAEDLRDSMEAELRCFWLIEELPFLNPEHMDELMMIRIMSVAGWNLCFLHLDVVKDCLEECRVDFRRSINKYILEYEFATNMDVRERLVALKVLPAGKARAPLARQGCLPLEFAPQSDYRHTRIHMIRNLLVAEEAFMRALQHFHSHLDIELFTLVCPLFYKQEKPWKLSKFERAQKAHIEDQTSYLKYEWPSRIAGVIEDLAPVVAELSEVAKEKLIKFVTRLDLTMSEQLQELVISSVEEFKTYMDFYRTKRTAMDDVKGYLAKPRLQSFIGELDVQVGRSSTLRESEVNLGEGKVEEVPKEPLFRLFLMVDDDRLVYKPSLEDVLQTMVALLEDMVECVQSVEGLKSRIRSLFTTTEPDILPAVSLDEQRVETARTIIEEVLELNFLVPKKLEQMYAVFQDLLQLNVDEYLEKYQADNHTLGDYEAEVTRFLQVADHVKLRSDKETLASMFLIDCSRVREVLGRKATSLAYQLCTQVMTETTKKNEIVRWKYTTMETRMLRPIENAEDLDSMVKYIAEIKFDIPQRRQDVEQSQEVS
ncbi:hypothetical protein Mapa_004322 [Marchantia paleacea]|nr:hypothetical protein Mapa_004322 [Marchantia paleacea]